MDQDAGGAFAAAAPPVAGLGNFKGVMLCNRPADDSTSKMNAGSGGPAPFVSAVPNGFGEQLGLPPCRKADAVEEVKTRGPSAALRRHIRWLRELQAQMNQERDEVEADEKECEERKQKMKAAFEKQREAVRKMMTDRSEEIKAAEEAAKAKKLAEYQAKHADQQQQTLQPQQHATKEKVPRRRAVQKPLWAMTEKEKEDFEDNEADSLLNFAENLDYDKYIGDLEFRHGVEALRDHAGKLQKEQDSFKDALVREFNSLAGNDEDRSTSAGSPRSSKIEDGIDGMSLLGDVRAESVASSKRSRGEQRYGADGRPEWDSSTNCGDERQENLAEHKEDAERVLESNPAMRAIHSKESVAKIIERAKERQTPEMDGKDLIKIMREDAPAPAPVIVQAADTQNRLYKPVDPSQLPYLYRSPAI